MRTRATPRVHFERGREESARPTPIVLDPEVVKTDELGLRSTWLDERLRLTRLFTTRVGTAGVLEAVDDRAILVNRSATCASRRAAVSRAREVSRSRCAICRRSVRVLDLALATLERRVPRYRRSGRQRHGASARHSVSIRAARSYSLAIQHQLPLSRGGRLQLVASYGGATNTSARPRPIFKRITPTAAAGSSRATVS